MNIKIKVVSLEKAKEIDNIITSMWDLFPPMYFLSEEVFGKEFDAVIAPEKENIPWFCYRTKDGWYIPNVYVETADVI